MPSSPYHESLWESIPAGLQPSHLQLRKRFLLAHVRAGERVLDVGCGEGAFTAALALHGAQPLGVDVAQEPLRRARALHPQLEFLEVPDEGEWNLPDASFDAVWAGEVVEHVRDSATWLSEVRRALRSGGTLLLSTPSHEPLSLLALALWPRAFAAHFDPRSDHLRFYNRASITRLLEDFGFERIEARSVAGLPGARSVLLVKATRSRF
jgi:2-polyprenyl-3-methyl-5-hydroxy-6-metoxy-1,4-benzoquinol methylase